MKLHIQFLKHMNLWYFIYAAVMVMAIGIIAVKGFNYGVDFTGGNLIELKFQNETSVNTVNAQLDKVAMTYNVVNKDKVRVQGSKDELGKNTVVIIRTPELSETEKAGVMEGLKAVGSYEVRKVDKIGATIGSELRNNAILALIIGTILIIGYISMRFEIRYALAAIIALVHDIIVAMGVISLLGFEVNATFIAAILTILGYSINDTIVGYDRIRESSKKTPNAEIGNLMDISINQVLGRSINTSVATLLALTAIALFGGDSLRTFTVTLIAGIASGTFSSIFVASPMTYLLEKKFPKKKDGIKVDTV